MTTREKTTSAEVVAEMQKLEDGGLGVLQKISEKEVFYKPLPIEENREKITQYVEFCSFTEAFKTKADKMFH